MRGPGRRADDAQEGRPEGRPDDGSDRTRDEGAGDGVVESPDRREIEALVALRALKGVGDRTLFELLERFGSGREAMAASEAAFAEVAGREAASGRRGPEPRAVARKALRRAGELGLRIVRWGGPDYPAGLEHLHDPPAVLFLKGELSILRRPAVAVVGSRRATGYGRRVAGALGAALARAGVPVVSGLALGIDAAAHRGALSVDGRVVGVLGSGIDVPHPPTNSALIRRVGDEHLLISEFLPGEPPLPHHFPRRNRILAALSEAVVVVEAAERSGALITADHATDLGREVIAVPGPVDRETSRGTNRLLRDGAAMVTDPARVVEVLPEPVRRRVERADDLDEAGRPVPTGEAGRVWRALEHGPRTADELARSLELEPACILALLSRLEVEGWAEPRPGMVYARLEPGSSRRIL